MIGVSYQTQRVQWAGKTRIPLLFGKGGTYTADALFIYLLIYFFVRVLMSLNPECRRYDVSKMILQQFELL